MRTLEEILHPVTPAQFRAEYEGRQPLHIPAADGSNKRALLTWDAFNGLLNQSNVWDSERLKLMRHDDAVPPEQYCRRTADAGGPDLATVACQGRGLSVGRRQHPGQ